eukprot:7889760-Pyramimonas_sp.AAC.1
MLSPTDLEDDLGQVHSPRQAAPPDLESRRVQPTYQWQVLRSRGRLPDGKGDEFIWLRAKRKSVPKIPRAGQRGAMCRLWCGGLLCPDGAFGLGLAEFREGALA